MCTMPPMMTCPAGYTLVNGMCQPAETPGGQAGPVAPPAAETPMGPEGPADPAGPVAPAAGMEQPCPTGYEYRDSMCYPVVN